LEPDVLRHRVQKRGQRGAARVIAAAAQGVPNVDPRFLGQIGGGGRASAAVFQKKGRQPGGQSVVQPLEGGFIPGRGAHGQVRYHGLTRVGRHGELKVHRWTWAAAFPAPARMRRAYDLLFATGGGLIGLYAIFAERPPGGGEKPFGL
jgi:hypothetical protein